jgi:hypothetical protein
MKLNKFQVYLYFCVTLFIVLLSAILFYTFGYQLDTETGEAIQTGGLVIKTPIKDVTVYQNGEIAKKNGFISDLITDFIKIDNLKPAVYNIEIKKDGYQTWKKNVEIKSGQVEKFENIVILKDQYENISVLDDISLTNYEKIWHSKIKNQIIYISSENAKQEAYIADIAQEKTIKILDSKQVSLMGDISNVSWVEDSDLLAIEAKYNNRTNLHIIETKNENRIYTLTETLTNTLVEQKKDNTLNIYGNFVVFAKDGSLFSFNYKTKVTKEILKKVKNFDIQGKYIYFFKTDEKENCIFRTDIESADYEIRIANLPAEYDSTETFKTQEQNNRILLSYKDFLYLIDKSGEAEKISSDAKEAFFFQGGRRALFYNENEIWVYYTEDKLYQPDKQKGEKELITRFSGNLADIYMYQDEEHVMYKENNELKFAEMDGRDNRNIQTISKDVPEQVFYSRDNDALYSTKDGKIFKVSMKTNE